MSGTTVAERYQPTTGASKKMKKPFGTARKSCGDPFSKLFRKFHNVQSHTSTKMSLCRSTLRIFAKVIPIMITTAPIMKPCDHASRVNPRLVDGLDIESVILAIWR